MGKGNRHMKNVKAEKAKVKLKAKKAKPLPKGLNVTNPTFKVKKIVIREQLKRRDETEILSKRKLNVKVISRVCSSLSPLRATYIMWSFRIYCHAFSIITRLLGKTL